MWDVGELQAVSIEGLESGFGGFWGSGLVVFKAWGVGS